MNPVDLIRELADSLDTWTTGLPAAHRDRELLRQTQAFLAARPVVVELDATIDRNIVEIRTNAYDTPAYLALDHSNYATGPCTVHVVVTPGAR